MDEASREKIRKLANLTKEEIGNSEEDVKINFIVPLFEAFGHERLKFEHRWKDALVEEVDPLCKLIIETKNYDKDLNKELQQLKRYCDEERPLLGIIANGREMRIYSHFWRYRLTFPKTLIYCINRKDLNNENVIQKIENILSITNLKNGKAKDFIVEKESEIENEENKIESIEKDSKEKVEQLQVKIDDLSNKIEDIENQVEKYKSEKKKIIKETREQILQIWQNLRLPQLSIVLRSASGFSQPFSKDKDKDKDYIIRYRKMLEKPDNLPSKMKSYIDEKEIVIYKDLKRIYVEQFGCQSETSGSIAASVKLLENDRYIKIEGKGNNKQLISLNKE
jgi:hypothetical protein